MGRGGEREREVGDEEKSYSNYVNFLLKLFLKALKQKVLNAFFFLFFPQFSFFFFNIFLIVHNFRATQRIFLQKVKEKKNKG